MAGKKTETRTQTEVEVKLVKPHTHNGKPYTEGQTIKVTPGQKDWLTKKGKINDKPAPAE